MVLALILGVSAFIILLVMMGLLWASGRKETDDPVTQEIIIKANTGPVHVHAPVVTQEDKD